MVAVHERPRRPGHGKETEMPQLFFLTLKQITKENFLQKNLLLKEAVLTIKPASEMLKNCGFITTGRYMWNVHKEIKATK